MKNRLLGNLPVPPCRAQVATIPPTARGVARVSANPIKRSRVQTDVGAYRHLLAVLGLVAVAGCPASSEEVRPPRDQVYFPSGMALSPAEDLLFAVSANSDLRYSSGMVSVFDVDLIDDLVTTWLQTGEPPADTSCERDLMFPHILSCDESEAIIDDATVRIGNFATAIDVQTLASGDLRLFIPVRGDPSVTWIDVDAETGELSCGGSAGYPECDEAHRLTNYRGDAGVGGLLNEPFEVFVDSQRGYAVVSHLTRGAVSLVSAPVNGDAPVLADAAGGLFAGSNGAGAVGVAGRQPGTSNDLIYVTSRSESRVQILYVDDAGGLPFFIPADFFFLNMVRPSSDSRGIAFSDDGNRAFIVNRNPPMLHIVDTSLGETGVPRNVLMGAVELCDQPSNVALADTGSGPLAYVACFNAGQVWVIDPATRTVDSLISVGRGPHGIVASESKDRLYVGNFLENTIAVVDIEPGSATENRVVLRLGEPDLAGDPSGG